MSRSRPSGRHIPVEMDEARCPKCGNESENVQYEREGDIQPLPPQQSAECGACGHRGDPLTFHHRWKWERMTEDEREQAREARERFENRMAEYQHSATYHAAQREP